MWKHGTIEDVLSMIQNGVNCTQDKSGKGHKITRIETIADANINYGKTGFSELDEKQKIKAALVKGDILFSHINSPIHVGKTAIYNGNEPLYHGINLLRLRTIEEVDSSYFNRFLISLFWSGYWKRTAKQSVNQASVNQTDIKQILFSYPPLAEQQRIVAKLDAAFEEIDKAVVATKQETSQTTSLYNCMVKSLITDEINDSEACCIGDLVEEIVTGPFGSALHKSDYIENGIPVINPQNLFNGNIVPNYGKSISLEMADSLSKYKLRVGDILIGRRGEMGRCALVSDNESDYICGTGCMIVRPNGKVGKQFLFEILQSNYVKKKLEEGAVGATMLNLNQKILLSIPISIRSLDEQEKSIDAIYAYGNDTQKFNFNLERKIELLSVLKSAILAQELKGETA